MKKIYYLLTLEQKSPLRIGNSNHEQSDNDLMLDGRGMPFIPGTSLCGILRHRAEALVQDKKVITHLFGNIETGIADKKAMEVVTSAIIVGDAVLAETTAKDAVFVGRRDGIGLNEWGTSKKRAKFDFQICETGLEFRSVIEWTGTDAERLDEIENVMEPMLKHYISNGICVGARTSRGYGKFTVKAQKKVFSLPEQLEEWLDFDPYAAKAFSVGTELVGKLQKGDNRIEVDFEMVGTFSVRVKTAKTELAEDGSVPDSVPMENYKGNPVIPGTTWAGVFRHHMLSLLKDVCDKENEIIVNKLFGVAENPKDFRKSQLTFSESEIKVKDKHAQKRAVIRNAVERFTAAPKNTGLFTSMVYSGGMGTLQIDFLPKEMGETQLELLAATICDMHLGMISVGGEASVGRGIMQVKALRLNGNDITAKMQDSIEKGSPLNWLKEA